MAEQQRLQKVEESGAMRVFLTGAVTLLLGATLTLTGLAGTGTAPFTNELGNVSHWYDTCITPADYTFFIWNPIFVFLILIVIYSLSQLCRKERGSDAPVWKLGSATPMPFLLVFTVNLSIYIGWLFAWDREELRTSAILLILLAITNIAASRFSTHGFYEAAPALKRLSRVDFWCGLVVIYGYATYTTWTCLAACVNLAAFLIHEVSADATPVCITLLSLIPVTMIVVTLLDAVVFERSMNVLFCHHLVYLWAATGIYSKNSEGASSAEFGLLVANIFVAAALCVARAVLVAFRSRHSGASRGNN